MGSSHKNINPSAASSDFLSVQCIYAFFTCLGKATCSKLDEAHSFEAQKCGALVCAALLLDCVSAPDGLNTLSVLLPPQSSTVSLSLLCPFTSLFSRSLHRIGEMDSVKKQT